MADIYAQQIKALKPASGFVVKGEKARKQVIKTAWDMKRYGVIAFDIVTREGDKPGEFKVFAG